MTVTVVGLGKIGLPIAVQFARKGEFVLGVDINQLTVDLVNSGEEPFPEEANLCEYLDEVVSNEKLVASTNLRECVAKSNVVVVVVPLFLDADKNPEFKSIDSVTHQIAQSIKKGTLVSYETTLPIGTTRNRFAKIIEEVSGLKVGKDFYLVFSPERVLTGRIFEDLKKYPKIVGGVTKDCGVIGSSFYSRVLEFDSRSDLKRENGVWNVGSSETAEFVKIAETTYRDVNIALANTFAIHAEEFGVNIYEVIEASNSQKFSNIHSPGIAVGGHCIPVYPNFYLSTHNEATLVRNAREINERMPKHVVNHVENFLGTLQRKKILILGLSYRAGVKEPYGSGSFTLQREIESRGGSVFIYDHLFSKDEVAELGFMPWISGQNGIDAVIIQNEDKVYEDLIRHEYMDSVLLFDGRNSIQNKIGVNLVYQLGNALHLGD
jgi:UDP-N-acetyl-D-glucosamine dehydrogenase